MAFKRLVIAVIVFVIVAGGAFTAFQVADHGQDAAGQSGYKTVTNESISQQVGIYQLVNKSTAEFTTGFNESVTVYNSSGAKLLKGTDYQWNRTDGAIYFNNTANTTDGNSAKISYNYSENTQDVKEVSGPLTKITQAIGTNVILAGGITLVIMLLAFAGFLAKKFASSGPGSNR